MQRFRHGFGSEFAALFTEVGTEGTGLENHLKKRAEFLQKRGKWKGTEAAIFDVLGFQV